MHRALSKAAAIILLGVMPAARAADQPRRLAVLQLVLGKGVSVDRETFSSCLQNAALKAVPTLSVMTQANILEMVQAQGKTLDQCEGECAVETGRLLGADFIVTGRISMLGQQHHLSMQLYESMSGILISGDDVDAATEEQLLAGTIAAAPHLFAPLAARVGGSKPSIHGSQDESRVVEQGKQVDLGVAEEALVKLDSDPVGAVVRIDGHLLCQSTPCSKMLAIGAHEFTFEREGYEGSAQRLQVATGLTVSERLVRVFATLSVETEPSGIPVRIDGEQVGDSPVARRSLALGTHEVTIGNDCWLKTVERVVLQNGEDRILRLVGHPRQAGLKLSATNEKGDAVEGKATLDGKHLGVVPGSYVVSACASNLSVEGNGLGANETLTLREGESAKLVLSLHPLRPAIPIEQQWRLLFIRMDGLYMSGFYGGSGSFPIGYQMGVDAYYLGLSWDAVNNSGSVVGHITPRVNLPGVGLYRGIDQSAIVFTPHVGWAFGFPWSTGGLLAGGVFRWQIPYSEVSGAGRIHFQVGLSIDNVSFAFMPRIGIEFGFSGATPVFN